ncbi:MAG: hypothetical protein ABII95_00155 [Patescibacteria group bacterium]|nr:hypothetical protein [Patescibacteria group bacterium]
MKEDKEIIEFLKSFQKELSGFFGINVELPMVSFINSRKEIDKIWGRKTEEWFVAWAKDNNIFILNPKIYTKESSHKNIEHFWKVLKHEYSHLYYKEITNNGRPKWLNEGLACYLANQVKEKPTKKESLKIFEYYQKGDWLVYRVGYFWVKLLIDKFGKKKLLKLLKKMNSQTAEKEFAKIFYRVYGFKFSEEEFNKIFEV